MQELRRRAIAEIVQNNGSVTISELADRFETSGMTIHRDLDYLQKQGILTKKRGCAVATSFSEMFANRSIANLEKKCEVARKAYDLIEDHDVLAMDGSTTSIELAKLLKTGKNVTVFTNSLYILYELEKSENVELYVLGSYYSHQMVHLIGTDIEARLSELTFSKCFVGAAGVSETLDLYDPYPILASIKAKMIHQSMNAYAVVDSSKFGKYSVQKFCNASDLTMLISDDGVKEPYRSKLAELNGD